MTFITSYQCSAVSNPKNELCQYYWQIYEHFIHGNTSMGLKQPNVFLICQIEIGGAD